MLAVRRRYARSNEVFLSEASATLDEWVNNGWLRRHTPVAQEIADLFAVAAYYHSWP